MNYRFYKTIEQIYDIVWIIIYGLYFAIMFGLSTSAPKLLPYFDLFIKTLICLFLILRFNPYNHIKFSNLDQKIAFTAGFFILSTTLTNELIVAYTNVIKNKIKNKAFEKKRNFELNFTNNATNQKNIQ